MTTLSAVQKMQQALQWLVDSVEREFPEACSGALVCPLDAAYAALHSAPVPVIAQPELIAALSSQGQCDEDGTMCIVSRQAVNDAIAALQSPSVAPVIAQGEREGVTPEQLIAFLDGSGEIDGYSFGDKHPNYKGVFWWRKYLPMLRAVSQDRPAQGSAQESYMYHYHASHQSVPGNVLHMDGILTRATPVDSAERYQEVKSCIAEAHGIIAGDKITMEALTPLAQPPAPVIDECLQGKEVKP